ncbi:MAG: SGNH/GDSL hydrolase family protein [Mesosutterella sp.]|nr:SGNH/GDSL hydrolase family protein [Mesosutterella sp.]
MLHSRWAKLSVLTAFCLGFAAASGAGVQPEVKDLGMTPKSILIVGNSYMYYNCGLNGYLGGLIREKANPKIETRIAAIGRGNLSQYPIAEYLDNNLLASHDKTFGQLGAGLMKKELKKRESYDLVIMQASNRGVEDQKRDAFYVPNHVKAIRAAGGTPVMLMTWVQRKKGAPAQSLVADSVTKIANDNHMMVIPVGLAFEAAQKAYPDVKFIMPDNTHPTAVGSYLMASTIYAALYHRDPVEATGFAGGCEKPLEPAMRQNMARVAWDTVKAWYGWK